MLLVKYQPTWAQEFEQIQEVLFQVLDPSHIHIEHVGSTSVMNLASKPIIDMDIVYKDAGSFQSIREQLKSLEYYHAGDQGITGREVFKRKVLSNQHPVLDTIAHHLYVCHYLNDELQRHLSFRNTLREDENARMEYEQLKFQIAEMAQHDKKKYALLKEELASEFITSVLSRNT